MDTNSLTGLVTVLLIVLLVTKTLASASFKLKWRKFGRTLDIAIIPILAIFIVDVAFKLYGLMR